jgi:hypothetical protein
LFGGRGFRRRFDDGSVAWHAEAPCGLGLIAPVMERASDAQQDGQSAKLAETRRFVGWTANITAAHPTPGCLLPGLPKIEPFSSLA